MVAEGLQELTHDSGDGALALSKQLVVTLKSWCVKYKVMVCRICTEGTWNNGSKLYVNGVYRTDAVSGNLTGLTGAQNWNRRLLNALDGHISNFKITHLHSFYLSTYDNFTTHLRVITA